MSEEPRDGIVCGFGDVAGGLGGLAWDLGEPGALLLSRGGATAATFAIEEGGDAAALSITAGDTSVEATLAPRTAEIPLPGAEGANGIRFSACAAEGRPEGGGQTFPCSGYIARWSGNPLEGSSAFRFLAIESGDEAFLIAAARGRPEAAGHGEEQRSGWRLEGETATRFEETLISTQYDGGGNPTRFGLELWPEDADQSSRAAAIRVSASSLGAVQSGGSSAGMFRCHTDGAEGFGSYLLWRA